MHMYNPPHPGVILKEEILPNLGLTADEFAAHAGISRVDFCNVLDSRSGVSSEMDIKLSEALGQPAGLWINMQNAYDLWLKDPRRLLL